MKVKIREDTRDIGIKCRKPLFSKKPTIPMAQGGVAGTVNREYFSKIDLRVGKVVEASRVEGSRKLIKLIVDLGSERRQIIAGLAEYYRPEELVGKYVVVVANMEPRRMFGLESQGMLLATCGERGKPLLVTIEGGSDSNIGERVC